MDFDMNQFFSNWDTADSYAALAITLIGFLFGLLIGYLLRGPRIRRLRRELEEANQNLVQARQELGVMKDQLDQKEADLQRVNFDLVEMTERLNTLEEDKAKLYKDVFQTNQEVEKHQAATRNYQVTIEGLNHRVEQLEEELEHERNAPIPDVDPAPEEPNVLAVVDTTTAVNPEMLEETNLRLARFEAKLAQLESENEALKIQIKDLHPSEAVVQPKSAPVDSSDLIFEIDDVEEEPELAVNADKEVLHEKIMVGDIDKDDLTRIDGVGPFLQSKLHEMGVFSFAEIAQWDTNRVAEVTERISYFPGRIEKDNWVEQANNLYQLKQAKPAKVVISNAKINDLKIVEGVGPKIEQLLKDAGIENWHDLAEAELERLQAILDAAGERYRIHDPGTWSQQARLAADGKLSELEQLQDELKGGRKVD